MEQPYLVNIIGMNHFSKTLKVHRFASYIQIYQHVFVTAND